MKHAFTLCAALAATLLANPATAHDGQPYQVTEGRLVLSFHESVLESAGLQVTDLDVTGELLEPIMLENTEPAPIMYAFELGEGSNLRYLRDADGTFVPYGVIDGGVEIDGGFRLWSPSTGTGVDFNGLRMAPQPVVNDGPGGEPDPDYFFMATSGDESGRDLNMCYVKVISGGPELLTGYVLGDHDATVLVIKAWDLIITEGLAAKMRRPELAGAIVATGKIEALTEPSFEPYSLPRGQNPETPYTSEGSTATGPSHSAGGGDDHTCAPYTPLPGADIPEGTPVTGLDVQLGILSSLTAQGHVGTFPNGRVGMSSSTTSCNVGCLNVTWLAAMNEDHPGIDQFLFRELDVVDAGTGVTFSRYEQIGRAWIKHGFFALSSSQCTSCIHSSPGTFLGVGCSDTYGTSNNGDRFWLGPRSEWDAFENTWENFGSYFDGTPVDGVRDENGSGNGSVNHRLECLDSELDLAGANYYYGSMYLVDGDEDIRNNSGTRRAEFSWTGSSWNVSTPNFPLNLLTQNHPLVRWGELGTPANNVGEMTTVEDLGDGTHDGNVVLSVQVTDLLNGTYRYEYVLYNWNLERRVREFSVPNCGASTNQFFRDSNNTITENDWAATGADGNISWEFPDLFFPGNHKETGPLDFGTAYNFGFTSNKAPEVRDVSLRLHDAGLGGDLMLVETLAPGCLNLSSNTAAPETGGTLEFKMRGGTERAWMLLMAINDVPITPILIPPSPFDFVAGEAVFGFTVPAAASGFEFDVLGAEVPNVPPIWPLGFTNTFKVKIQ